MIRDLYNECVRTDKVAWMAGVFDIYERMKDMAKSGAYEVQCNDISITVLPNVYAPTFFTDSLWFAEQLTQIVGRRSLLEIGTGTGIISICCAKNGARVVATDINPAAVKNARLNANTHGVDISIRGGYTFERLKIREKFDYIFWAHPFNNWGVPVTDMMLRSGMDYNYEGVKGYIAEANDYLTPNGKVLLGTGDSADLEALSEIAEENGYTWKILKQAAMPLEEGGSLQIRYLLCELIKEC